MLTRQEIILRRLREEGQKIADFFQSLNDAQLDQQVYTTGPQWRARNLIAHFVSAERMFNLYGRQILAGGPGAPEDFVIDEFNAIQVEELKDVSLSELVRQFEEERARTVEVVSHMADSDFDRIGRHPWFGKVPLEQMLKLIYRHTMIHERDIRKALETGQPVPHVDVQPPEST